MILLLSMIFKDIHVNLPYGTSQKSDLLGLETTKNLLRVFAFIFFSMNVIIINKSLAVQGGYAYKPMPKNQETRLEKPK